LAGQGILTKTWRHILTFDFGYVRNHWAERHTFSLPNEPPSHPWGMGPQGTWCKRNNTAWSESIHQEYGFKQPYTRKFRCACVLSGGGRPPRLFCGRSSLSCRGVHPSSHGGGMKSRTIWSLYRKVSYKFVTVGPQPGCPFQTAFPVQGI